ncbi:hypothetical protein SteCoe_28986 [Stentor coeruleus]|uniref:Uncharacterized protein n=1 Tax=Stentor coeruleus TaxID=5963 RepID=A0A1R2B6W4_9CILI|nr:hypothetical protein SteCoe_28986 [Stentor coeruleus]
MEKIEEILIEKYKNAEEIRKSRNTIKQQALSQRIKQRAKELKTIQKVTELEMEAKIAWRFREGKKLINEEKKLTEKKIKTEMLRLKVKLDLKKQENKLKRTLKPQKSKLDPINHHKNIPFLSLDDEKTLKDVKLSLTKKILYSRNFNATPIPRKNEYFHHPRRLSPEAQSYFY